MRNIDRSFFAKRSPLISYQQSHAIVAGLQGIGLLAENGTLLADPAEEEASGRGWRGWKRWCSAGSCVDSCNRHAMSSCISGFTCCLCLQPVSPHHPAQDPALPSYRWSVRLQEALPWLSGMPRLGKNPVLSLALRTSSIRMALYLAYAKHDAVSGGAAGGRQGCAVGTEPAHTHAHPLHSAPATSSNPTAAACSPPAWTDYFSACIKFLEGRGKEPLPALARRLKVPGGRLAALEAFSRKDQQQRREES